MENSSSPMSLLSSWSRLFVFGLVSASVAEVKSVFVLGADVELAAGEMGTMTGELGDMMSSCRTCAVRAA